MGNRLSVRSLRPLALSVLALFGSARAARAQGVDSLHNSDSSTAAPELSSTLNFQTDLFTGRFAYSIPIEVPPARGDTQPGIVVAYDSSRGNGAAGVGWALDMGFIQRDGRHGVPVRWHLPPFQKVFDDAKGFVFSFRGVSSQLVPVHLVQTGQPFGEYRAKVDRDFLRFDYLPAGHWVVTQKDGTRHTFGDFNASQLVEPDFHFVPAGANVYRWMLAKSVDANGNKTEYQYTNFPEDVGNRYLQLVAYGGNQSVGSPHTYRVDFEYEPRADVSTDYRSGFRISTSRRLKTIRVGLVSGASVRRYEFGYTPSESSLRSLLTTVDEYGSDGIAQQPTTTFAYTEQPYQFAPTVTWANMASQGTGTGAHSVIGRANPNQMDTHVALKDMNGDGLPDRVMREETSQPRYAIQYNTGSGFSIWQNGLSYNAQDLTLPWKSVGYTDLSGGSVKSILLDMDGNGFPDRVESPKNGYTGKFLINLFDGKQFTDNPFVWGGIQGFGIFHAPVTSSDQWIHPVGAHAGKVRSVLMDMNGDGLPDRLRSSDTLPHDEFHVQLNTGVLSSTGLFAPSSVWPNLGYPSAGQVDDDGWRDLFFNSEGETVVGLYDMNGDGLPDRLMRRASSYTLGFKIQFNDGLGFDDVMDWTGPLQSGAGLTEEEWNSPICREQDDDSARVHTFALLEDVNGDGLLDRVMRKSAAPFTHLYVQLNYGNGFGPAMQWGPCASEGLTNDKSWASPENSDSNYDVNADLEDMNGDGLLDRVLRNAATPSAGLRVELSLGPVPDLLSGVDNGMGGSVTVTYRASTAYDNQEEPWTTEFERYIGNVGMLPFPVQTVATVTLHDGFQQVGTTGYDYMGGWYDAQSREFRGFHRVIETDPLGAQTRVFFHQGGGRDGQAQGEYPDDVNAQAGFPYRVELWGRPNGVDYVKFSETVNLVGAIYADFAAQPLWRFPAVLQAVETEYEVGATPRSRAREFVYDMSRGAIERETDYGEVTGFLASNHSFTDVGADKTVTDYEYETALTNPDIVDRPKRITVSPDGTQVQREILFTYEPSNGNLLTRAEWLDDQATYRVEQFDYDAFGNVDLERDAAGVVTTTAYEPTFDQYPTSKTTGGFTTLFQYSVKTGALERTTDVKGLVVEHVYDELYRLEETRISSVPNGTPDLWRERFEYALGGVSGGVSSNSLRHRVQDGVDAVDGHETWTYSDGFGRPRQVRAEAETGEFRVSDTLYDARGKPVFQSFPRFVAGTAFSTPPVAGSVPGVETSYDSIGRAFRTRPTPIGGDVDSPTGAETRAFQDGSDPWAEVLTDAEGKVKRTRHDAHGRIVAVIETIGAAQHTTQYVHDNLGNLVDVVDRDGNVTHFDYNSLGQRTLADDPDLGAWTYTYDAFGRPLSQTDAKQQRVENVYDGLGRVQRVKVYDASQALVDEVVYHYDSSNDAAFTVYPGQLFKIEDGEGWQKYDYDHRGRVRKTSRRVDLTNKAYVLRFAYDEGNHVTEVTYPFDKAKVACSYDSGGHLRRIESVTGTGQPVVFYEATGGFEPSGQLKGITYGNTVVSTFTYYSSSRRLKTIVSKKGRVAFQSLAHTYDRVGNVKSVADAIHGAGASGSLAQIQYDDLHRLSSYQRDGAQVDFTYSPIGNVLTNGENPGATYEYLDPQPHAVSRVGTTDYDYDANGNMRQRGAQTLTYDAQNRLVQVSGGGGGAVGFGYAHDGQRLWKDSGAHRNVWIGDFFEERDGQQVCHVIADERRIASFVPVLAMQDPQPLGSPGGGGATPIPIDPQPIDPQPVTATVVYYHQNHVGSTNLVTDKTGAVVSHFEYRAFGGEHFASDVSPIEPLNLFTDQGFDADTGLYYYGARYYDPSLGRFVQPDPLLPNLANPQALNRYTYVLNNPLRLVDPSGNFSIEVVLWTAFVSGLINSVQAAIVGDDVWDAFVQGAIQGAIGGAVSQLDFAGKADLIQFVKQLGDLPLGIDITGGWADEIHGFLTYKQFGSFADVSAFVRSIDFEEVLDSAVHKGFKELADSAVAAALGGGDLSDVAKAALSGAHKGLGAGVKSGLGNAVKNWKPAPGQKKANEKAVTARNLLKGIGSGAWSAAGDWGKETYLQPFLEQHYPELFGSGGAPPPLYGPRFGRTLPALHMVVIGGVAVLGRSTQPNALFQTPRSSESREE